MLLGRLGSRDLESHTEWLFGDMEGKKMATTALIAYGVGTAEMLDVCLSAIERHVPGEELVVRVITDH